MDHLALVSAAGQPDIRASQQSDGSIASSAQLHKQLLAAEVAKLRKELATLKAQEQQSAGGGLVGVSEALKMARMEKERKEAEKAEVVAQANQQKQMLAGEVKSLRGEIQVMKGSMSNPLAGSPMKGGALAILPENVTEALERRKAFEEQFSMTLRSLREELMDTSIKRLSSRSQTPQGVRALLVLSDERIDRIMAEAAKVPVDERLHIEAVRLFIENCKFRKALNEYARGMLQNVLTKDDPQSATGSTFGMV